MKDGTWHFEVDNRKGGRMFVLCDGFTHKELVEMAQDDYKLYNNGEVVELTYSLPTSMLQQMPRDTPPMHVTNDRHVQSLMELSRTHVLRLCVSSRFEMDAGITGGEYDINGEEDTNNDAFSDEDEDGENDANEDECNDQDESKVGEVNGGLDGDVKDEYEEDIDDDYSEYGKVKDEDEEDISFDDQCANGRGSSNFTWSDGIFVNQIFLSKEELVRELRLTAVMLRFAFKVFKSTPNLFVAICRVDGCKWRVRAAVKNEANRFWVTKYIHVHTCSLDDRVAHRKHATSKYIGKLFLERVGIINGITPEHIKDSMKQMFGMRLNYTTSYRALLHARELVRGTAESGYESLPSYLHEIKEAIPGTITSLEVDDKTGLSILS